MKIETVCIFCGSSSGRSEIYRNETEKLADFLSEWGKSLVHGKAVSLYNIDNFFEHFSIFLDSMKDAGFLKDVHRKRLVVENQPEVLLERLESFDGGTIDKWS